MSSGIAGLWGFLTRLLVAGCRVIRRCFFGARAGPPGGGALFCGGGGGGSRAMIVIGLAVIGVGPGVSLGGWALLRRTISAIQNKHPVAQSNRPNCKERERDRVSVHTVSTAQH